MSASGCTAGEQSFNECFSLLRLVVRDPDHGAALTCQEESRMPRLRVLGGFSTQRRMLWVNKAVLPYQLVNEERGRFNLTEKLNDCSRTESLIQR